MKIKLYEEFLFGFGKSTKNEIPENVPRHLFPKAGDLVTCIKNSHFGSFDPKKGLGIEGTGNMYKYEEGKNYKVEKVDNYHIRVDSGYKNESELFSLRRFNPESGYQFLYFYDYFKLK